MQYHRQAAEIPVRRIPVSVEQFCFPKGLKKSRFGELRQSVHDSAQRPLILRYAAAFDHQQQRKLHLYDRQMPPGGLLLRTPARFHCPREIFQRPVQIAAAAGRLKGGQIYHRQPLNFMGRAVPECGNQRRFPVESEKIVLVFRRDGSPTVSGDQFQQVNELLSQCR